MKDLNILIALVFTFTLIACGSKPKVIEGESLDQGSVFNDVLADKNASSDEHKVVVEEVLNTAKYTYLNVTEGGEKFWIAVPRKEVEVGETYLYKGGLLKKNFKSEEFNRIFETVYLVSGITKLNPDGSAVDEALARLHGGEASTDAPINIKPAAGAIKISELMANLDKYEGKLVKITGKCMKVNPMIMNRNWVHIQDGSVENSDLTVTTMERVMPGTVVTLEGTITLNKDFGAGYRYDVIMEEAVLK